MALSTIQNIDFIFVQCIDLPDLMGIDKGANSWEPGPEYIAYLEKECGKIPEDYDLFYYHTRF